MKSKMLFAIFVFFLSCVASCVHPAPPPPPREDKAPPPYTVGGKVYYPLGKITDYKERGIASWYGTDFHGKKTSSGERYDMYASTAAHRILPFGTNVQVTNLENGEKTTVVINDRGPFAKNRIIDLSYKSAQDIGLIGPGTASVELEVVGVTESASLDWKGVFTVQIGSFRQLNNAFCLKEKISLLNYSAHINTYETRDGLIFYQVRVGKYNSLEETIQAQKELALRGFQDAFIVAE